MLENKLTTFGLTPVEIKETDIGIHNNLQYLFDNFPDAFDELLIQKNIETILDLTISIKKVKDNDYSFIALIWRYSSQIYLKKLINQFEEKREKGLGNLVIQEISYKQAYNYLMQELGR